MKGILKRVGSLFLTAVLVLNTMGECVFAAENAEETEPAAIEVIESDGSTCDAILSMLKSG